jgi:hypothetical protein
MADRNLSTGRKKGRKDRRQHAQERGMQKTDRSPARVRTRLEVSRKN